jgi:hypothetical protein
MQEFFVRVHNEGKRLILARLKDSEETVLSALPEVTGQRVMLSGPERRWGGGASRA